MRRLIKPELIFISFDRIPTQNGIEPDCYNSMLWFYSVSPVLLIFSLSLFLVGNTQNEQE